MCVYIYIYIYTHIYIYILASVLSLCSFKISIPNESLGVNGGFYISGARAGRAIDRNKKGGG